MTIIQIHTHQPQMCHALTPPDAWRAGDSGQRNAGATLAGEPSNAAINLPAPRLPRDDLLVYSRRQERALPVKTPADWRKRRAEIKAGMQAVMGPLPGPEKRCSLEMEVQEEVDCGTYVRRLTKAKAQTTKCASNMKNWGLATVMYLGDYVEALRNLS